MRCGWLLCLALSCAPLVAAAQQVLPALYDVTGVAAGDVLNIRAKPDASAEIVGRLPRNAKSIEVVATDATGKWAIVNTAEQSGFVALRFLVPRDGPDWGALTQPLTCFGTEPFWSLGLDPATGAASLSDPETPERPAMIRTLWPNTPSHSAAALVFDGAGFDGFAALRGESCSDGMSDKQYGIGVSLFMRDAAAAASPAMHGCCTLNRR